MFKGNVVLTFLFISFSGIAAVNAQGVLMPQTNGYNPVYQSPGYNQMGSGQYMTQTPCPYQQNGWGGFSDESAKEDFEVRDARKQITEDEKDRADVHRKLERAKEDLRRMKRDLDDDLLNTKSDAFISALQECEEIFSSHQDKSESVIEEDINTKIKDDNLKVRCKFSMSKKTVSRPGKVSPSKVAEHSQTSTLCGDGENECATNSKYPRDSHPGASSTTTTVTSETEHTTLVEFEAKNYCIDSNNSGSPNVKPSHGKSCGRNAAELLKLTNEVKNLDAQNKELTYKIQQDRKELSSIKRRAQQDAQDRLEDGDTETNRSANNQGRRCVNCETAKHSMLESLLAVGISSAIQVIPPTLENMAVRHQNAKFAYPTPPQAVVLSPSFGYGFPFGQQGFYGGVPSGYSNGGFGCAGGQGQNYGPGAFGQGAPYNGYGYPNSGGMYMPGQGPFGYNGPGGFNAGIYAGVGGAPGYGYGAGGGYPGGGYGGAGRFAQGGYPGAGGYGGYPGAGAGLYAGFGTGGYGGYPGAGGYPGGGYGGYPGSGGYGGYPGAGAGLYAGFGTGGGYGGYPGAGGFGGAGGYGGYPQGGFSAGIGGAGGSPYNYGAGALGGPGGYGGYGFGNANGGYNPGLNASLAYNDLNNAALRLQRINGNINDLYQVQASIAYPGGANPLGASTGSVLPQNYQNYQNYQTPQYPR